MKFYGYWIAGGLFCLLVAIYLHGIYEGEEVELYFALARILATIISMVGIYIIIRALVILVAGKYLPQLVLLGGNVAKCCELLIIGVAIGFFAPVYCVVIWAIGSILGFLTSAFK